MPNPARGNMYPDVDFTSNIIRGICPFECIYCSIKNSQIGASGEYQQPPHISERELNAPYRDGATVFVGSAIDMFAPEIPVVMIESALAKLMVYDAMFKDDTSDLFGGALAELGDRRAKSRLHKSRRGELRSAKFRLQTKNPAGFLKYIHLIPWGSELGTTVETTNVDYYIQREISKAPDPGERIEAMKELRERWDGPTFITVEPAMDFDPGIMAHWIEITKTDRVYIGGESKGVFKRREIVEPRPDDIVLFVKLASKFCEVLIKPNIAELMSEKYFWPQSADLLRAAGGRVLTGSY